jgi:mono/diheme cytochrome c family protein
MLAALLLGAVATADEPGSPARFETGASLFQANCAVCHQVNGVGNPGLAPPLTGYPALYVQHPEGRRQLVLTVLYGMYGDVVVDERHYNFKMPEFARLDDDSLAAVLNFVVFDIGRASARAAPLSAAEVATERALALGGADVRRHRLEVLNAVRP